MFLERKTTGALICKNKAAHARFGHLPYIILKILKKLINCANYAIIIQWCMMI